MKITPIEINHFWNSCLWKQQFLFTTCPASHQTNGKSSVLKSIRKILLFFFSFFSKFQFDDSSTKKCSYQPDTLNTAEFPFCFFVVCNMLAGANSFDESSGMYLSINRNLREKFLINASLKQNELDHMLRNVCLHSKRIIY